MAIFEIIQFKGKIIRPISIQLTVKRIKHSLRWMVIELEGYRGGKNGGGRGVKVVSGGGVWGKRRITGGEIEWGAEFDIDYYFY